MEKPAPLASLVDLHGQTAFVTGAVGIGFGIAYRLAEAGAKVVVASLHLEEAKQTALELSRNGWEALALPLDVADEQSVKSAVDEAVKRCMEINILVNNAGIYPSVPFVNMTSADFDKVIAVNLRGVFLCSKYVSTQMIAQGKGGKIINISSIDSMHPSMTGLAHYDASKHGVWGFTKNIALELSAHKIWVNAIAPGGVLTPGVQGAGMKQEILDAFAAQIPMKRMGVPDDIGKVALFLASDMSSYMTGAQITVDGGVLLS